MGVLIQPINPDNLGFVGKAMYYTIIDALGPGSREKPFTEEQLDRLQTIIDSQDDTNAKLAQAGIELVDAVLDKGIAQASSIGGLLGEIGVELDDLFTGIEDLEIETYRTKVIRADIALQAVHDFKLKDLKEFYEAKLGELKSAISEIYSEATLTNWVGQMKGQQFETVLEEVLTMVKDALQIAISVRDLVDLIDARIRDLASQTLQQANVPHWVDDSGRHKTRRQQ